MKPFLLLSLAAAFLCGCSSAPPPVSVAPVSAATSINGLIEIPPDSPKLQQITVAAARLEELPTDEFTAPGKLEVNPNRVSKVLLPVTGRITDVLVRFGDAVRKDQILCMIESPEAENAVSAYLQAEGSIAQANSSLLKAQSDLDRVQDLFKGDAIAKKEVLAAETAVIQAKTSQKLALDSRDQAKSRLDLLGLKPGTFRQKIAIRAPLAGKITEMTAVAGEFRNDLSAPLFTIADLSTVWVSADVPESAIRFVKVGERFDVVLSAFPQEVLHSKVARMADSVDPETRTIEVWAELSNPVGRFRPSMFGEVRHIESLHSVVALPPSAIIQTDQRSIVFVETAKGKFRQTEIQAGKRSGGLIPVLSGIQPGDRVVTAGAMLLRGY
jgi:membrane fusion protein, heavy metal efflux system